MSRPGPARSIPRAGGAGGLVAADPESSDNPRQRGSTAPADAADSAALGPVRLPAEASGSASPFARWLARLVRVMRSRAVRFGFLAVVLALLAVALYDEAGTLWHEIQKLSAPVVLLAFVFSLCGLICSLMVWREMLADLGSRLSIAEAWRIMFIGQLGKYVPGSIWPVLAQSELGADRGIPRSRSALSVLLCYAVMTVLGSGSCRDHAAVRERRIGRPVLLDPVPDTRRPRGAVTAGA